MPVVIKPGSVTLYPGEPYLFINDPTGPVIFDLTRRMTRVQFEARKLVRVRTGRLLASIRIEHAQTKRSPVVKVVAGGRGVNYALYEHDGTRPHEIRARRRKSLRFMVDGQVVFRKRVWHPGTTGTLFLTMALPYAAI